MTTRARTIRKVNLPPQNRKRTIDMSIEKVDEHSCDYGEKSPNVEPRS